MLRENIHLGWSQSPEEENIKYILESRNAPGLNLDARSQKIWLMLMLQSVHTSWAEKEEDGKGWNQHASLHLALICKTSPSNMICESGATHSVPHLVGESASLGEVLFPRSHGHDYVIGSIHHMLFCSENISPVLKTWRFAKLLLRWPKAAGVPRPFDVTILTTWSQTAQFMYYTQAIAPTSIHKPTIHGQDI